MFHPLITPLTTYMYTTDIQDNGTVSATDEERLPPGGFSLRHGFPDWFGRGRRSRQVSSQSPSTQRLQTPPRSVPASTPAPPGSGGSVASTPGSAASSLSAALVNAPRRDVSTYDVLRYIRSTFDDENILDSIPIEAAGNPGAWHAWRTHRRQTVGKALPNPPSSAGGAVESGAKPQSAEAAVTRRPGEWNWEGVWEERTKRGIATSLSEAVLYGNASGVDEVVSSAPET